MKPLLPLSSLYINRKELKREAYGNGFVNCLFRTRLTSLLYLHVRQKSVFKMYKSPETGDSGCESYDSREKGEEVGIVK